MPPVHLHIGLAKTGTTAIQNHLKAARETLAAAGICYPSTGMPPDKPSHVSIALECQKPFADLPNVALRNAFIAETAGFERVIVSSEGFQNITDLRRVSTFLREVNVVCCLREYLDLWRSLYAQVVQSSSTTESFDEFCARMSHFDLSRFLDRWERFSGSLTLLSYSDDIVPAFFKALDIAEHYKPGSGNANPTISGNLLAFKLRLNALAPHQPMFYNGLHRLALQDARWRGPFHIGKVRAARLRTSDNGFNKTFAERCGEVSMRDFTDGNLIEPEQWAADVERFLADRAFEPVRDLKALRETP